MTERRRFARFLAAGGIAAIVNILARIVLNTAMPYEAAIPLAYLIGMIVAYALNRNFVFEPSGRTIHDEWARFFLINAIGAAQVWVVSVALARFSFPQIGFIWHAETVAHVVGVLSPVFTSYLGHKLVSFRAQEEEQEPPGA